MHPPPRKTNSKKISATCRAPVEIVKIHLLTPPLGGTPRSRSSVFCSHTPPPIRNENPTLVVRFPCPSRLLPPEVVSNIVPTMATRWFSNIVLLSMNLWLRATHGSEFVPMVQTLGLTKEYRNGNRKFDAKEQSLDGCA